MTGRYFLDTNILVYAHDKTDPQRRKRAQKIIFDGIRNDNLVLSTQVLSEFYVTVTQKIKKPLPANVAKKEINLLRSAEIVEINLPMIVAAIDLHIKNKISYWDGLIIASAQAGLCTHILTEDLNDAQKFGKLTIMNPFKSNNN